LLDHWTGAGAEAPRQDVAERLGQWLGMHDALRLQAAQQLLVSGEHAPAGVERPGADADALGLECRRLRAALQAAIAAEQADPALGPEAGFPAYHRRYLGHQRRMQASIDSLRGRAREAAAAGRGLKAAKQGVADARAAVESTRGSLKSPATQAAGLSITAAIEEASGRAALVTAGPPHDCERTER
jgi:hypothetical protein